MQGVKEAEPRICKIWPFLKATKRVELPERTEGSSIKITANFLGSSASFFHFPSRFLGKSHVAKEREEEEEKSQSIAFTRIFRFSLLRRRQFSRTSVEKKIKVPTLSHAAAEGGGGGSQVQRTCEENGGRACCCCCLSYCGGRHEARRTFFHARDFPYDCKEGVGKTHFAAEAPA